MRFAPNCSTPRTPADRLYFRRAQIAVSLCLITYIALSQTAMRLPLGPLHTSLAALSGLFFLGELIAVGLLVYRRFDEFQRTLLLRSFLWANVITIAAATTWGFAELGSHGTVPHIPYLVLPATLIVLTTAAKVFFFRRNRSTAE